MFTGCTDDEKLQELGYETSLIGAVQVSLIIHIPRKCLWMKDS